MKDLMSGGLVNLARTANTKLGEVQSAINRTVQSNNQLAASYENVERKSSSSSNTLMANAKRVAAAVGVAAIAAGAIGFAKDSVQAALRNDMQRQSFSVLTGNKGIGNSLADQLNKLQQDTVLGPGVFKNAQTMLGFGAGAEDIMPSIKMLGDVSMGDAGRMEALTLAFSQVRAAGKLTGQDLLQFVNAGFNPLNEIAKMTGKSMGDLKEEMSDGKVSFDMVQKAFEKATGAGGLFNGMLDKMGATTGGKVQQLEGSLEALKINIGNMLKPVIDSTVTSFAHFIDVIKKATDMPIATQIKDQVDQIKALQSELTATNTNQERRLQILKELEQINPSITAGINAESIEYGKLASNINNVVNALNHKKIASEIENENLGVITKYNRAKEEQANKVKDLAKLIGEVPGLAERTDMTMGQKQIAARKYWSDLAASKSTSAKTKDGTLTDVAFATAAMLKSDKIAATIKAANEQAGIINGTGGQVRDIQGRISKSMAAYDAMFGIKEMKKAQGLSPSSFGGGGVTGKSGTSVDKEHASRATGGGPRVINISGVTMKVADKIEVTANNAEEFINGMEPKMKEMFLRLLQSGSQVQN